MSHFHHYHIASIDMETDALVQRMVRDRFANCTVLTIAHRLDTIIDSDRIAVMDKGYLAEYDTPKNLLSAHKSSGSSGKGLFKELWMRHQQETGGMNNTAGKEA